MRIHHITALIVAAITLAIYPAICHLAYLERGYIAYGGEDALLALGLIAAFMIADVRVSTKVLEVSEMSSEAQFVTEAKTDVGIES